MSPCARGKNPLELTAEACMSQPVVTVDETMLFDDVVSLMEKHQIRRILVVDTRGRCIGMISQADVAWSGDKKGVADFVREVSRDTRSAGSLIPTGPLAADGKRRSSQLDAQGAELTPASVRLLWMHVSGWNLRQQRQALQRNRLMLATTSRSGDPLSVIPSVALKR